VISRIKSQGRYRLAWVLILCLLAASFGWGFILVRSKFTDLVLASQIIPVLTIKYYQPLSLSRLVLTYWQTGSLSAVLASLNDPYTRYLPPEEYNRLLEENKGVYGGVGLYLGYKKEGLVVFKVMKNSPAAQAGLQPGDRIIAINRQSTVGMAKETAAAAILGPPGTTVFLTIQRGTDPFQTTREIALIRTLIDPSIEWEIRWDGEVGKIGWITLSQFTKETGTDLRRALQSFTREQVTGIVLDLRYNPGGLLVSALEVASQFLPGAEGHPLVFLQYRNQKTETFPAWPNPHPTFPLVVLINEWSASSAEIVAAAIKDLKAGVLVGNTTFGKGLVQDVIPLRGGGALYFTVARYLTAGGYSIHDTGVEPDIRVTLPNAQLPPPNPDPSLLRPLDRFQAETALQVLKELIRGHRKAAI
jgi:carboxyl-terminal processing protease